MACECGGEKPATGEVRVQRVNVLAEAEDLPICWICLDGPQPDRPLMHPCRCPSFCHAQCIARWQLQSAGTRRERFCDFCSCELPDWKDVLTPKPGATAPAVMNVNFDNKTYSFQVAPGADGYRQFTEAIRKAFHLPDDSELNITFTCDEPSSAGSLLTLSGPGAYDAAVHCASVSAARRSVSGDGSAHHAARQQHAAVFDGPGSPHSNAGSSSSSSSSPVPSSPSGASAGAGAADDLLGAADGAGGAADGGRHGRALSPRQLQLSPRAGPPQPPHHRHHHEGGGADDGGRDRQPGHGAAGANRHTGRPSDAGSGSGGGGGAPSSRRSSLSGAGDGEDGCSDEHLPDVLALGGGGGSGGGACSSGAASSSGLSDEGSDHAGGCHQSRSFGSLSSAGGCSSSAGSRRGGLGRKLRDAFSDLINNSSGGGK